MVAALSSLVEPTAAIADDAAAEEFASDAPAPAGETVLTDTAAAPAEETVVADAAPEAVGAAEVSEAAAPTADQLPSTQIASEDLGLHWYTVSEVAPEGAQPDAHGNLVYDGVTYDQSVYRICIDVFDNGEGSISAELVDILSVYTDADGVVHENKVTMTEGDDGMGNVVFHNTYAVDEGAAVDVYLTADKVLTGRDMVAGEFSFKASDASGEHSASGVNGAPVGGKATVSFGKMTFDTAGSYEISVREVYDEPVVAGVTYDQTVYTVTVVVEDDGQGGLKANVIYPEGGVTFTNEYSTEGSSATVDLEASKVLTGRDMAEGEFGFVVEDSAGNVLKTASSPAAADGESATFSLGTLTFTAEGTYDYVVRELNGGLGGVSYDTTEFPVKVTVTDDGKGGLAAEVAYPEGGIAFENTYGLEEGASTAVTPVATKTLTGRALADGEFTFTVADAEGAVVSTGTNDASGAVDFTPITFTETGTYEFTIAEVNGRQDDITYDDSTFTLVVTVADDGQGGLVAANVEYPDGTPAFTNVYEEPEPEQPAEPEPGKPTEPEVPEVPKTGDATNASAVAGAAAAGAALVAGAGAFALRRRAIR